MNIDGMNWLACTRFISGTALPLQGGGLRWGSSSYPESIIARWDHVRRPRP
jgi:hypothetical protein